MSDRRFRPVHAAAGVLLLLGMLLAVAVLSHDPADQPGPVWPTNPTPHNLLGSAGAWASRGLLDALGAAVYILLAGWFVLTLLPLVRRSWVRWSVRLAGWVLLTATAAALAAGWPGHWPGGPASGPGGALGAWLAVRLAERLAPAAQAAVYGVGVLLGLALAAGPFLRRLVVLAWRLARPASRPRPVAAPLRPPGSGRDARAPGSTGGTPASDGAAAPRTIPIFHHDQTADAAAAVRTPVLSEQERFAGYKLPPLSLLEDARPLDAGDVDGELRDRAALLEKTFADFGLTVRVVGINTGPVVTQFEIALETGLRVHKVTRLSDDVALNLKAPSVRIVAPIPGKNTVGVEVPNERRADVRLKEVILASGKKIAQCKVPLFLGKDSEGRPLVHDLADMPHLLLAGRTGTGKSVCLNAVILSMLMTRRPDEVKMIMIDPKNGVELGMFGKIPHLMHPVIGDMKKAEAVLAWAVDKMEERYELLNRARVRNIAAYNQLKPQEIMRRLAPADDEERDRVPERLPYIVLIVDEMADLIMTMRKEVEGHIIRLTQKSRAAGIHLVVATQKPTVDVITGLIKSNLPARICFKVTSKSDSRVVLDEMGADKLLGKGDMLFLPPGGGDLVRAQGAYASDEEIRKVVELLECDPCYEQELMLLDAAPGDGDDLHERLRGRDPLYAAAVEVVVREQRGSVSLLQRALGVGYGRAARLIDFMAEDGIVGAYNGSNAREVLYTPEAWSAIRKTTEDTEHTEKR
jgi:S-DNA-T family DNA segregation ATPase FtsK/SpoIIIE